MEVFDTELCICRSAIVVFYYAIADIHRIAGFDMFEEMINQVKRDTARAALTAIIAGGGEPQRQRVAKESAAQGAGDGTVQRQPVKKGVKVGRNDPCPCGSGKKYKNCCLDKDNK